MPSLEVLLAPPLWTNLDFGGSVVVVVDVLRATTCMVTALEHGAAGVVPAPNTAEARRLARRIGPRALLTGEEDGVPIPGFDRGNSPRELTEDVLGRVLVMKTTNGTRALLDAAGAKRCLAMSLQNVKAVAGALAECRHPVRILPAGLLGDFSFEDNLCAGYLVAELAASAEDWAISDAGRLVQHLAEHYGDNPLPALHHCEHGRKLLQLGYEEDLAFAARLNTSNMVPVFRDGMVVSEALD
jgi:2-phosphosulfolactate phosphatase